MIGLRKPPASRLLQEAFEKAIDLESYKPELIHSVPATFVVMRVEGVGYVVKDGKTGKIEYVERDWDHAERAIQWAVDNLPSQGGTIKLMGGTYKFGAGASARERVFIRGDGERATIIDIRGLGEAAFKFVASTTDQSYQEFVEIAYLRIEGDRTPGSKAVHLERIGLVKIHDIQIRDVETGIYSLDSNCDGNYVERAHIVGTSGYGICIKGDYGHNNGWRISKCVLVPYSGTALRLDNILNPHITDSHFECPTTWPGWPGGTFIHIYHSTRVSIQRNFFMNTLDGSHIVVERSTFIDISQNHFGGSKNGDDPIINIIPEGGVLPKGITIKQNKFWGVDVNAPLIQWQADDVTIDDNEFRECNTHANYMLRYYYAGSGGSISGNKFVNCNCEPGYALVSPGPKMKVSVYISGGTYGTGVNIGSDDVIVENSFIEGAQRYGIAMWNVNNPIVRGNIVKNCSQESPGTCDGIRIGSGTYYAIVDGNRCYDDQDTKTQRYGIYEESDTDHNQIIGNIVEGNMYAISKRGSNTVVRNNKGHPTDSFKLASQSVEIGSSDSYGSPTEIASPSGVISHFVMVLHITAGAGEIITAKVELLWEDGSTTSVEKQLDNSGGTAAASQDFEVPETKAEEISLWLDKNSLRKIRVYAKTDQTSPTADASVTFDIAGAG